MKIPITILGLTASLAQAAIDLDTDGLPDIWQQRYGAQSLVPLADDDKDGFNNLAEASAGTNPFVSSHHPTQTFIWHSSSPHSLLVPTQSGKTYQPLQSQDLVTYTPFGSLLYGNGNLIEIKLPGDNTNTPSQNKTITHQLWANISGNDLTSLKNHADFPHNPHGTSALSQFQIPLSSTPHFGGRLRALITPPQTATTPYQSHPPVLPNSTSAPTPRKATSSNRPKSSPPRPTSLPTTGTPMPINSLPLSLSPPDNPIY